MSQDTLKSGKPSCHDACMTLSKPSRTLRILHVVDTLDAGGMETQLVALINRLDPLKFKFEVFCLRHAGVLSSMLKPEVKLKALEKPDGFQIGAARDLHNTIRRGNFDVVHTHNWGPLVYTSLATLAGQICPVLHGEHAQLNDIETLTWRLRLRRLLYRCCSAVHTVSIGQKDELLRLGLTHTNLWPLVNGVNIERFLPISSAPELAALRFRLIPGATQDFWLGMVARFGIHKRHRELISAFELASVNFPRSRLILVGDGGPEKENVIHQIKASPLRDRIHFFGYQSDPVPYYQAMDALIVPSANEGLSNATLEAMACGVPVLSNAICGAHELIGNNEGGWVEDLKSVKSMASILTTLFTRTPFELKEIGCSGRQRALQNYSWDGMTERYATAYRNCSYH